MEEKQIIKGKTQSGEYKDLTVFGGEILNIYDLPSNATVGDILRYDGSNWIKHTLREPHYLTLSGFMRLNAASYNSDSWINVFQAGQYFNMTSYKHNNVIDWLNDAQFWTANNKKYKLNFTVHLFSQNIGADQLWQIRAIYPNQQIISQSHLAIRVDNENISLGINGVFQGTDYILLQMRNSGSYSNPSYMDCNFVISIDELHEII